MQDALGAGRQGINVLRTLPHHLSWYLRELSKRNYAFDVRNRDQVQAIKLAASGLNRIAQAVIGSAFLACGTWMIPKEVIFQVGSYPLISIVFLLLGMGAFALALLSRGKIS
jgi:hypothetical protein